MGIWFYYQLDKNSKYSWMNIFFFGDFFLQESLKPTISFYTQSSLTLIQILQADIICPLLYPIHF